MRTVVEEAAVSQLLDTGVQQYPRLYKQAASYGVPSITALYSYDDAQVVIKMIKLG
jgi:hypothetical protein